MLLNGINCPQHHKSLKGAVNFGLYSYVGNVASCKNVFLGTLDAKHQLSSFADMFTLPFSFALVSNVFQ